MGVKELIQEYREAYSIECNRKSQNKTINMLSLLFMFSFTSCVIALILSVGKVKIDLMILSLSIAMVLGIFAYHFFHGIDTLSALENKIKKANISTDPLSEIFDMECQYAKHVLTRKADEISKHVAQNKGFRPKFIINLIDEINDLKYKKISDEKLRVYQDLYYLSKGCQTKKDLVSDDAEKAKIFDNIRQLRSERIKRNNERKIKFSDMFYVVISLFGFALIISITAIAISSPENIIYSKLYILWFFPAALLLTFVISNLPIFRISRESLYDLFDMSCPITYEYFKRSNSIISANAVRDRGICNFYIFIFRYDIKKLKELKNKTLSDEDKAILMNKDTRLGRLLVDVEKLKEKECND